MKEEKTAVINEKLEKQIKQTTEQYRDSPLYIHTKDDGTKILIYANTAIQTFPANTTKDEIEELMYQNIFKIIVNISLITYQKLKEYDTK